jgi:transcriptional regulator with PAS, ATPase and Fis domain
MKSNQNKKLDDVENRHILQMLHANNGDKVKTSKDLNIAISTLYRKLKSIAKSNDALLSSM